MASNAELSELEDLPTDVVLARVLSSTRRQPGRLPRASTRKARRMLEMFGGLPAVARASPTELAEALGEAAPSGTAAAFASVLELARRIASEGAAQADVIESARDVAGWATPRLGPLSHEELWLLALDGRNHLRATRCVAKGGLHGLGARAADALRLALRAEASGFVLVHNHPSGDPTPSAEDHAFTEAVARAAAVIGVPLLDHVVVGRSGFSSVPMPELDG